MRKQIRKPNLFRIVFTWPVVIYSLLLIFAPLVYIFILSFEKSDNYGGVEQVFTLENYADVFDPTFLKVFAQSALIGLITTFICLLIAYPFAICLRKKSQKTQNFIIETVYAREILLGGGNIHCITQQVPRA